jgi:hypothetical protein
VKTVYEHLKRVGLERYAPALEFHGIMTEQDLAAMKLEDIEKLSAELQFDAAAQRLFKLLLDSDNKTFVQDSYALAEVTHIRESFLAAYADTSNEDLIKTVCTPLLRHHSRSSFDCSDEDEIAPTAGNTDAFESRTSESSHSSGLEQTFPADLSEQRLRELSKSFCAALSVGGKGVISHFNLRRLLDAHPNRPAQCVKAAAAFTRPRTVADKVVRHLDLYAFLKRLGMGSEIHKVIAGECDSLATLLDLKGSVREVKDNATRQYKIDAESALRLAEVVTKTSSESGNLMNFGLYPRSRIIGVFQLFYTAGAAAFPLYTASKNPSSDPDNGSDASVAAADSTPSETATDGESPVAEVVALGPPEPASAPATTTPTPASAPVSASELERLAYQFGLLTSDDHGTSLVSVLEVLDHLRRHPTNPAEAVATIAAELVSPPFPAEPPVVAREAPPVEWVDEWLKTSPGSDITSYAQKFKDQGFVGKEDFLVGAVLTLDELDKMGIAVLAHRRRLVVLHAKLLAEHEKGLDKNTV